MSPSATPPARRRGRTTANELSRFFELLRAGGELDGVRILEPRTIRRATSERAFREIDFSLVAPLRHAADPERALSVGLVTSGKPMLHPALGDLWLLTRAIGQEAPKVTRTGIWFTET